MRSTHSGTGRRLVIVSRFSPLRDGTAKYADQLVAAEQTVREVLPVGLPGSGTSVVRRLDGGMRPLRLLRLTARGDEVWLMWHPEYYISGRFWSRVGAYLSLALVLRRRTGGINVQYPDLPVVVEPRPLRRPLRRLEEAARRRFWRSAARVAFHSQWERDEAVARFGSLPGAIELIENGATYRPYIETSQVEARLALGLPEHGTVFACLGFIAPGKGFDRALVAFERAHLEDASLHVVGSVLHETPEEIAHAESLEALAARMPKASVKRAWVEDEEFDLWLQASNVVVAPYRTAASSGVIGRAKLHDRRVIATPVGGLPEQLGPNDFVVSSDDELVEAFRACAASDAPQTP